MIFNRFAAVCGIMLEQTKNAGPSISTPEPMCIHINYLLIDEERTQNSRNGSSVSLEHFTIKFVVVNCEIYHIRESSIIIFAVSRNNFALPMSNAHIFSISSAYAQEISATSIHSMECANDEKTGIKSR